MVYAYTYNLCLRIIHPACPLLCGGKYVDLMEYLLYICGENNWKREKIESEREK